MPDTKEEAIKYAQKLADIYHRPYYVVKGKIENWTTAAWSDGKKRTIEVVPSDGNISGVNYW